MIPAQGSVLRKADRLLGRGFRRRWVTLAVLALATSCFEIVGAGLLLVLLTLISDPSGPIDIPLLGDLRGQLPDLSEEALLVSVAVVLGVFFLLRAAAAVAASYAQARVAQNAGARLSHRLVRGYLQMPYVFHLTRDSSSLIRNSHQSVTTLVGQVVLPSIRMVADLILVAVMLVLMVAVAPLATALSVAILLPVVFTLLKVVQPRLRRLGVVAHQMNRETHRALQQAFLGIRDVKLLGRESDFANRYAAHRFDLARTQYLHTTATQLPTNVVETALIGFVLAYLVTAVLLSDSLAETLSVLGLFAYAGLRLRPSIQRIVVGLNNLRFASAVVDELSDDLSRLDAESRPVPRPARSREPFHGSIELQDVWFTYPSAHAPSVRGVSLEIRPGEVIGVAGPSGGGKSTLLDLIVGLTDPCTGTVLVDGRSLPTVRVEWQAAIGVVSQRVFLMDGSIASNVTLGASASGPADDTRLEEAVRAAQLGGVLEGLPEGLRTCVGELGNRLSGGQRQRIAIARALYREPAVLVLDEATAALDGPTAAAVLDEVRGRGCTTLVASHQPAALQACDRVLWVEDGQVRELGEPEGAVEIIASAGRA